MADIAAGAKHAEQGREDQEDDRDEHLGADLVDLLLQLLAAVGTHRLRLILEDIDELGSGLACLDKRCDEDGQRADTRIVGELLQGIGDIHEAGVREHIAESSASAPSEFSATVRTASSKVEPAAMVIDMRSSAFGSSRSISPRHSRRFWREGRSRKDVADHASEGGRSHGGKSRQLGADEDADDDSHGDADDLRGPEHERGRP